jgi:hypothetical protein
MNLNSIDHSTAAELSRFFKVAWEASANDDVWFHIDITLTRGTDREVIEIDNDGTLRHPTRVFGTGWSECSECERFSAAFREISSKNELYRAHSNLMDFIAHLSSCSIRNNDVHAKIEFEKNKFTEGFLQSDGASLVKPSIWLHFTNLCKQLRRLTILDFHQTFFERIDRVWIFFVHDLGEDERLELLGISILPLECSGLQWMSRQSLTARIERLSNDAEGMRRQIVATVHVLPPTFFVGLNGGQASRITACCGHAIAYSFLCTMADELSFEKEYAVFGLTFAGKTLTSRMKFSQSNEEISIEEDGIPTVFSISDITKLLDTVCARFSESLSSQALGTLRKTCVRDLVHEGKFSTFTDLLKDAGRLLDYYSYLKEQLLTKRLEEVDAILDRLWATATQTSKDILDMLESLHKEVETASMLVFGTLGFEAYLFASQAITTGQIFTLLLVFGLGLIFFVLFMDFRICGISEAASLAIDNLESIEKQVTSATGLGISTDWKRLPEISFKNLNSRIDTVETAYWAFLTLNNLALIYVLHGLFASGIYWPLGVFLGPSLFFLFLGALVYERRAKQGVSKLTGRTRIGGFFLITSLASLAVIAGYCILFYRVEITAFLSSFAK